MPIPRSPEDLLTTELKEISSAERQLTRALPKLQKQITSERLREMLNRRRDQGAALIEQLDEIFEEMEVSKGRVKNVAAEGLLEDMNPDSPDGLGRQDRRPRQRWQNCRFLLSPVGSVMTRLPDPA